MKTAFAFISAVSLVAFGFLFNHYVISTHFDLFPAYSILFGFFCEGIGAGIVGMCIAEWTY